MARRSRIGTGSSKVTWDVPLSPVGIAQARALGESLVREGHRYTHIFSSDLQRARQTAETVLSTSGGEDLWRGVAVCHDSKLRERNFGAGEGKSRAQLSREAKSKGIKPHRYLPEGAETDAEIQERAATFFSEMHSLISGQLLSEDSTAHAQESGIAAAAG